MNSPLAFEKNKIFKDNGVDFQRLLNQFFDLYNYLASESCVYLIPNNDESDLLSLATSNVGSVMFHDKQKQSVLLNPNNNTLGKKFFEHLGYKNSVVCPFNFEGELNIKYLKDNIYIGGYYDKTSYEVLNWLEEFFKVKIIKLELNDDELQFLSNSTYLITNKYLLISTGLYNRKELKELEEYIELVDVSINNCYQGVCNNLRLANSLITSTTIFNLKKGTKEYALELKKNRFLEDIAADFGMELVQFNLLEYNKINFGLSDLILTLNNASYLIDPF
jgi:hypothetical protein